MNEKCTVIVSVYKNTRFLRAVLDSLKWQTEQRLELIVSEDGESEEMKSFLGGYSFPWRWQHLTQPDIGWRKNRALNRAILSAHAEQLIFIDGDCVLHPRFVEMHVRHFAPDAILTGKRVMLSKPLAQRVVDNPAFALRLQPYVWASLFCHRGVKRPEEGVFLSPDGLLGFVPKRRRLNYLTGCNMSFSRQAIESINGFDEDYTSPAYGEDTDLVWRFRMAGYHFTSLRNMAVEYHLWHPKSWTDQTANQAMGLEKSRKGEFVCRNGIIKK